MRIRSSIACRRIRDVTDALAVGIEAGRRGSSRPRRTQERRPRRTSAGPRSRTVGAAGRRYAHVARVERHGRDSVLLAAQPRSPGRWMPATSSARRRARPRVPPRLEAARGRRADPRGGSRGSAAGRGRRETPGRPGSGSADSAGSRAARRLPSWAGSHPPSRQRRWSANPSHGKGRDAASPRNPHRKSAASVSGLHPPCGGHITRSMRIPARCSNRRHASRSGHDHSLRRRPRCGGVPAPGARGRSRARRARVPAESSGTRPPPCAPATARSSGIVATATW